MSKKDNSNPGEKQKPAVEFSTGEKKFRSLFENMISGFALHKVLMDDDGRPVDYIFLEANDAFERLTGIKRKEIIGKRVTEALPGIEKDPADWIGTYGNLALEGGELRFEQYSETLKKWYSVSAYSPEKGYFVSVFDDITSRKRIEEELSKANAELERRVLERTGELEEANKRFKEVLDMLPAYLVLLTPDYHISFANRFFEERFGKSEGRRCFDYLFKRKEPCEICETYTVLKTKKPHHWEWTGPDGRNYSIYDFPFTDVDGSTLIMEVGLDVTEQKKLEEQLRQSQKMEAIGQLAGGVAHDFNNRLSAITNNAFILKSTLAEDDPLRRNVRQILSSAENAAALTKSLLAFSRKQVMSLEPLDLNGVIKNIERLLARVIGEEVKLETSLVKGEKGDVRPLIAQADAVQLENVLMNLGINARDAMPGGGSLSISARAVDVEEQSLASYGLEKAGSYAVIAVSDTGTGMDAETKRKIFEPFFTTKGVKGTGLGLSMAYGVLKQHGGNINVYSEPGKGTTFRLYLPLSETPLNPPLHPSQEGNLSLSPLLGGNKGVGKSAPEGAGAILLAEDDAEVREATNILLTQFGYKVIEAEGGKDALQKLKDNAEAVSLLILDVLMPDMNGKEVYEEAKRMRPGVKALFTSGYSADIISGRGLLEEGAAYVSKPATPAELLTKIRELLGG